MKVTCACDMMTVVSHASNVRQQCLTAQLVDGCNVVQTSRASCLPQLSVML